MATAYLIDTDVASESAKSSPSPAVTAWLEAQRRLAMSAVTVFELSRGIERLPSGRKRLFLEAWLDRVTAHAEIVPFDHRAALLAASLEKNGRAAGRGIDFRDLFILATAQAAGVGIATGNVAHFRGWGVPLVDPFGRG